MSTENPVKMDVEKAVDWTKAEAFNIHNPA